MTDRSGSTVANSVISAAAIPDTTLTEVQQEAINQLGKIYPIITDSKALW